MVTIHQVDLKNKREVNDFVLFPFQIYSQVKQWVPPIIADIKTMLNKNKHPFYEHSDADFFMAKENGRIVGRIALLENKSYNRYHEKKQASFYLFECVDDKHVSEKIFERALDWVKARNLDYLLGPKGLSSFDGYGFLVEGFDKRQMMTMMNYNLPNYPKFVEGLGFSKVVDWVSCYTHIPDFKIPEKVSEIARRVLARGKFKVQRFKNKRELRKWAWKLGQAYNKTFINNWEYYPLTDKEIQFVLDNIMVVAVPDLIKVITYEDEIIGFLLAFPDISAALQKYQGRLTPLALYSYLREIKKTDWISLNGAGVLPEYHGRGGNALLMHEICQLSNIYPFKHAELTQIAETATEMRKVMVTLGVLPYKNHRIYGRTV